MKKSIIVVVLALALVLAFTGSAFATSGKFWNFQADYYSWGGWSGNSVAGGTNVQLSSVGANPTNPGVHANYLANTAKCGICHSVHRAAASGVKLLNTATATCAGCHKAGSSTVTNVLVSWQLGGPHSGSSTNTVTNDAGCNGRKCHLDNPHGSGGSQYKIFAAKLINNVTDLAASGAKADLSVAAALTDPVASGITTADLNADASSTWDANTRRAVVVGYTCNSWGCHEQSMLPVLKAGYSEQRLQMYPESFNGGAEIAKTGHQVALYSADATRGVAFAPVNSCTSCHDQKDDSTRTGYTFPHSQTPYGASNMGATRAYLWMGYSANASAALSPMGAGDKAFDGACLKCHRSGDDAAGIGRTK